MKKNKVILVGAVNKGKTATCGETAKNQILFSRFRELFDKIICVDTLNWKRRPWVLIQLFITLLFNRGAKVVISASRSASYLITFLHYIPLKKNVYFWVIGGDLHIAVQKGVFNVNHMRSLKCILVEGINMKNELNKYGLDNVIVTPNAKPIIYLPTLKNKNKHDIYKFVFLSRVHPHKGIKEIYEATKILNDKGYTNKFSVDLYGKVEPSFANEFNGYINELENMNYQGFLNLTNNDGYKTLSSYDVMLFPTYWGGEGFPGIVIDANMSGLPIIASDWNMNKEVIEDGKTGYIIPVHDSQALANHMEQFIIKEIDLFKMKSTCIEHVKNFDSQKVISKELLTQIGLID